MLVSKIVSLILEEQYQDAIRQISEELVWKSVKVCSNDVHAKTSLFGQFFLFHPNDQEIIERRIQWTYSQEFVLRQPLVEKPSSFLPFMDCQKDGLLETQVN
jgi:hypothetical protein